MGHGRVGVRERVVAREEDMEIKTYELVGWMADDFIRNHEASVLRMAKAREWLQEHLPEISFLKKRMGRCLVDACGLHAVECDGDVPKNYKRRNDGMIEPDVGTQEGGKVASLWKSFWWMDAEKYLCRLGVERREYVSDGRGVIKVFGPDVVVFDGLPWLLTISVIESVHLRPSERNVAAEMSEVVRLGVTGGERT